LAKNDASPVDLSIGDIRSQIAAEWLQIAQRSQWFGTELVWYWTCPNSFQVPAKTLADGWTTCWL